MIVIDLDGRNLIELLWVYIRDEIFVNYDWILIFEIVSCLEYFKEIVNEIFVYDCDLDIGLLIGSNCLVVFVLFKVVLNMGDGFFVLKFNYGWIVSGFL